MLNQVVRGTLLDHMTDDRGGMRAEHSKILFAAATNFYEQLDEALIRKGRIDEHICLNDPSPEVGLQFLEKRFTDPDLDAESFTKEDIRRCYERLAAEKQQRFLEAELSRIRALPFEQQLLSDPQFMKSLEEKAAQQNPSIVEISNYFEDIKLRSFLEMQKNGTSAQKKIRVVFDRSGSEEELS